MNTRTQGHKSTRAHEHMKTCTLRVRLCACALVLISCLTAPGVSFAAGGDLITTFGTSGVVISDPSTSSDIAAAIAIDTSGIYIAGHDNIPGNSQWRIEKRDLTTGALISAFGTSGVVTSNPTTSFDEATAITLDASGIYVAGMDSSPGYGQWRIEKRDLTTGALIAGFGSSGVITSNPVPVPGSKINTIAANSTGIYVAGYDFPSGVGNARMRIEKRNLTNGALITEFGSAGIITSDLSTGNDIIQAIALNASGIYIVGYDTIPGNEQWRIEKRDLTTGALISAFGTSGVVTSDPTASSDLPTAITLDTNGIYITGYDYIPGNSQWRIEKRDLTTGALISAFGTSGVVTSNPSSGIDQAKAISVDGSGIYIAGDDNIPGNYQWRITKRELTTGAPDTGFGSSGVVISNPGNFIDSVRAITLNASGLYIIGSDNPTGSGNRWRIEKRELMTVIYSDCGVRMYEGVGTYPTRKIICETPAVSRLRVRKGGATYGIKLVDPTSTDASRFRVQTPAGVKAPARYGDWVSTGAYNGCYPPAGVCTYTGTTWTVPAAYSPCLVGQTYCGCVPPVWCSYSCSSTPYFYECR